MNRSLFFVLFSLISFCNISLPQQNNIDGFKLIKNGEYKAAVEYFSHSYSNNSNKINALDEIDSVYKLKCKDSTNNNLNFVLGSLLAKVNFPYNSYSFLNSYLLTEPEGVFAPEAQAIVNTLGVNKDLLKYINCFNEYQNQLRANNYKKAKEYWDKESTELLKLYDCNNYIYYFLPEIAKVPYINYVKSLTKSLGCVRLVAVDKLGENISYFEDKEPVKLISPSILFTRGGVRLETDKFKFYGMKDEAMPDSVTVANLTNSYEDICKVFDCRMQEKILYFKSKTRAQTGEFLNLPEAGGYAYSPNNMVVSNRWNLVHELTHLITRTKFPETNVNAIEEGTACYFGGTADCSAGAFLPYVKSLNKLNRLPSINFMLNNKNFKSIPDAGDAYSTMDAFVKYLIDEYGMEKFRSLYGKSTDEQTLIKAFDVIYKKNITHLEADFKAWLNNLPVEQILPDFNENANILFDLKDPSGDDYGDGNYLYPTDGKIKKGIYDIENVKLLADKKNVYFEIKMHNMVNYDFCNWGFYRTMINISLLKNNNAETTYDEINWDINAKALKQDMFFEISDIGISLWDVKNRNMKAFTFLNTFNKNFGDTAAKTIRFSIPISIIGNPEQIKGIIVGVSGRDTAYAGFSCSYRNGAGSIMKVGAKEGKNCGGGGSDSEYNCNFFDVLLPSEYDQKKILNYSVERKEKPVIPYVPFHK